MDILGKVDEAAKVILGRVPTTTEEVIHYGDTPEFQWYRFVQNGDYFGWIQRFIASTVATIDWEFDWYDGGATNRLYSFASPYGTAATEFSSSLVFAVGASNSTVGRSVGWHTLRFTYSSGVAKIYYDGAEMASQAVTAAGGYLQLYTGNSEIRFRDMTLLLDATSYGPYCTSSNGTTGWGFGIGGTGGTRSLTRIEDYPTWTTYIPGPAVPGDWIILGKSTPA